MSIIKCKAKFLARPTVANFFWEAGNEEYYVNIDQIAYFYFTEKDEMNLCLTNGDYLVIASPDDLDIDANDSGALADIKNKWRESRL